MAETMISLGHGEEVIETERETRRTLNNVIASMKYIRSCCIYSLGHGKPNSGTKEDQKRRFDVLDSLRSVSDLTASQANGWQSFKELWDEKMAKRWKYDLDSVFRTDVELLLEDLLKGDTAALPKWMEREREQFLSDEPILLGARCSLSAIAV